MDETAGIDKLRKIVRWADFQIESNFDNLSVKQIIKLFEKCQEAGVDVIEDIEETLAKEQ